MANDISLGPDDSEEFSNSLSKLFEAVIRSRKEKYKNSPHLRPEKKDIPRLIEDCARANAAISGAAGLVPGPLGMLTILPEILAVTRNQITLVYDIAVANKKDHFMTTESLAGIFISAFGTSATGLATIQGGKLIVKRSSLRVFQKAIALLGGKITQQAIKAAIGKWLPVVGAAALAAWTHTTTKSVGNKANKLLLLDIEVESLDKSDSDSPHQIQALAKTDDNASSETEKADSAEKESYIPLPKGTITLDDIIRSSNSVIPRDEMECMASMDHIYKRAEFSDSFITQSVENYGLPDDLTQFYVIRLLSANSKLQTPSFDDTPEIAAEKIKKLYLETESVSRDLLDNFDGSTKINGELISNSRLLTLIQNHILKFN